MTADTDQPNPALRQRDGDQPLPTPNHGPAIVDLVTADLEARRQLGIARYGTALQPHNGRDALRDAYEEMLDGTCYLRQQIYERDHAEQPPLRDEYGIRATYISTLTSEGPVAETLSEALEALEQFDAKHGDRVISRKLVRRKVGDWEDLDSERCTCGCLKVGDGCTCRFCNEPHPTQQPTQDSAPLPGCGAQCSEMHTYEPGQCEVALVRQPQTGHTPLADEIEARYILDPADDEWDQAYNTAVRDVLRFVRGDRRPGLDRVRDAIRKARGGDAPPQIQGFA